MQCDAGFLACTKALGHSARSVVWKAGRFADVEDDLGCSGAGWKACITLRRTSGKCGWCRGSWVVRMQAGKPASDETAKTIFVLDGVGELRGGQHTGCSIWVPIWWCLGSNLVVMMLWLASSNCAAAANSCSINPIHLLDKLPSPLPRAICATLAAFRAAMQAFFSPCAAW